MRLRDLVDDCRQIKFGNVGRLPRLRRTMNGQNGIFRAGFQSSRHFLWEHYGLSKVLSSGYLRDPAMDAPDSIHPADQTLRAYGVGKLYGSLADSVHSHLSECGTCRERVAELSDDTFLGRLRDAQARPDSPAPAADPLPAMSMTEGSGPSSQPPASGSIPTGLADHPDYEILGELGRGGMGVVYLARNKLMGRKEVLKVVSRDLMNRRGVLDRFLPEIRNAAQLHHANIVTAYSAIRAGESIVFAMEYVEGHDLAQLVKVSGPLRVPHACNFIYQAAVGLHYAHEKGMVHRDVKPSNLILARHGNKAVVKVLDFGLAKATREGPSDTGLTQKGQMLGTPHYIAPEQSLDAQKADTAQTSTAWAARCITC